MGMGVIANTHLKVSLNFFRCTKYFDYNEFLPALGNFESGQFIA